MSVIRVIKPLRNSYRSKPFMVNTRLMKVVKHATVHKSIDKLIQATGCVDCWTPGKVRLLFVVGDGDFCARKESALHIDFLKLLRKKILFLLTYVRTAHLPLFKLIAGTKG